MNEELLGCCGAYCGTCRVMKAKMCRGCKLGYHNGSRDISKAKCKIKICCIKNRFTSCADCKDYSVCEIIQGFHHKKGYKYTKYQEAIQFIRKNGYKKFFRIANTWSMQYGKYK